MSAGGAAVQRAFAAGMNHRKEVLKSLDDFATPPWAVRALCEWLGSRNVISPSTVREPCANRGYMADTLGEYFASVEAHDIADYGRGYEIRDFLTGSAPSLVDFTIANPPFNRAVEFIDRALSSSRYGVAMLVRLNFAEGQKRFDQLFSVRPPSTILQFSERVVMSKGVPRDPSVKYWDASAKNKDGSFGKWRKPSTATAYSWFYWKPFDLNRCGTTFEWLSPCRSRLERAGDYEVRGHNPILDGERVDGYA